MLLYVHCVAYLCAGVVLGWKPELSSKCRPILATQETLTDFQGVDAFLSFFFWKKKSKMADSKNSGIGPWVSRINWCEGQVLKTQLKKMLHPHEKQSSFFGSNNGSKVQWLPWFRAQNKTQSAKICNTVNVSRV